MRSFHSSILNSEFKRLCFMQKCISISYPVLQSLPITIQSIYVISGLSINITETKIRYMQCLILLKICGSKFFLKSENGSNWDEAATLVLLLLNSLSSIVMNSFLFNKIVPQLKKPPKFPKTSHSFLMSCWFFKFIDRFGSNLPLYLQYNIAHSISKWCSSILCRENSAVHLRAGCSRTEFFSSQLGSPCFE